MNTFAELSHGAYGNKDMAHLGYDIDTELSNRNRTLYHNKETGKAVYAFRGTDLKNKQTKWADLGTDALLAVGLKHLSSRFNNANRDTKAAITKYGKDNLTTTGVSLGGSQSLYVNSKHNIPAVAFNPYVEPTVKKHKAFTHFIYNSLFKKPVNSTATIYRTMFDPVSAFSNLSNATVKVVPQKHKDPHSIHNFFKRR